MTDHPRFRPHKAQFDAAYRDYHGGGLVHLVLTLLAPRTAASDRDEPAASPKDGPGDPMLALDRVFLDSQQAQPSLPHGRRTGVRAAVLAIFALLLVSALVQASNLWTAANRDAARSPDGKVANSAPSSVP